MLKGNAAATAFEMRVPGSSVGGGGLNFLARRSCPRCAPAGIPCHSFGNREAERFRPFETQGEYDAGAAHPNQVYIYYKARVKTHRL
jgi:hypothetical protein